MWGATHGVDGLVLTGFKREAKVNDLDLLCLCVKKHIVQLEIPMRLVPRVHVAESQSHLPEDYLAQLCAHPLLRQLLNVVVEGHPRAQLHDQVHLCALINHLEQTHYIRVVKLAQCRDFVVDGLLRLTLLQVALLVRFECDGGLGVTVDDATDLSESALANLQSDLKFFEVQGLLLRFFPSLFDNIAEFFKVLFFDFQITDFIFSHGPGPCLLEWCCSLRHLGWPIAGDLLNSALVPAFESIVCFLNVTGECYHLLFRVNVLLNFIHNRIGR